MFILEQIVQYVKKIAAAFPWFLVLNGAAMQVANSPSMKLKVWGSVVILICLVAIISIYGQEQ